LRERFIKEGGKEGDREVERKMEKRCPNCGGRLVKAGFKITRAGKKQRFQCTSCGRYVF